MADEVVAAVDVDAAMEATTEANMDIAGTATALTTQIIIMGPMPIVLATEIQVK